MKRSKSLSFAALGSLLLVPLGQAVASAQPAPTIALRPVNSDVSPDLATMQQMARQQPPVGPIVFDDHPLRPVVEEVVSGPSGPSAPQPALAPESKRRSRHSRRHRTRISKV
jgi:hypothetical protein